MVSLMRAYQRGLIDSNDYLANVMGLLVIANQLAFEAQSPGVQEVKSVSYRHQKRPVVGARR
jgi:hypothetical protein